jgi:hypothetical protein
LALLLLPAARLLHAHFFQCFSIHKPSGKRVNAQIARFYTLFEVAITLVVALLVR